MVLQIHFVTTIHCVASTQLFNPYLHDNNLSEMEVNSLITALESGDFHTALPLLENMTSDQLSQLTLPDKSTPLHYACRHGRVDVAQQLITHCKYSIESKDGKGRTPLHTAAQYGQVSTLKYLLHNLFMNEESSLSLRLTSNTTLSRFLSSILELKLSDRHRDESGNTPLHTACIHGQFYIIKLLINEIGCDPLHAEQRDEDGGILESLMVEVVTACSEEYFHVVRFLVDEYGFDPSFQDGRAVILFLACLVGHMDMVTYLLTVRGYDPHCTSIEVSCLHAACVGGHLDVVKYLVETHHCDPFSTDKVNTTPYYMAAAKGRLEIVSYIAMNTQNDLLSKSGSDTPLHGAASNGHLEVVKFFIEDMKCDLNCKGQYKRISLHHASENGHLDVVKYLVNTCHCDPLYPDENNETPLHRAALNRESNVAIFLISTLDCITPLHLTALCNNLEVVKFFINDLKYNPKSKNQLGRTPLHYASAGDHLDIVIYLAKEHRCDPLCPDNDNMTPVHSAVLNGQLIIAKLLIILYTLYYSTSLNLAALCNNLEVIKFLIMDQKYDPNSKNKIGRTLLHHASEGGHLDVVKYLVDTHHCNPLHPDRNKTTPLHLAAAEGQLEIVQYFANIPDCNLQVKNAKKFSPLDIASQCGHHEVGLFLICATTTQHILQSDLISLSLNIFVIGNSGSGKSTLVKALSDKSSFFGRFFTVKNVAPLTAGIVPTTINSRVFGSVNIYDFAGLLKQISHPLVLLTVDISLPLQTIKKQILYWVSVLSNSQNSHVVVIGSHADKVTSKEKSEVMTNVTTLLKGEKSIKFCGFVPCDCRYSSSNVMGRLRHELSSLFKRIRRDLANGQSTDVNRLCACLMYYLKYNIPEQPIITVSEVKRHINAHNNNSSTSLNQLEAQDLLLQTCENLSSSGHLFFIPHAHDENQENSILVLKNDIILDKVHACLTDIKNGLPNKFGILDENQLTDILKEQLKDVMEPEHAIKYLIFAQFCTEIAADQLISLPNGEGNSTHYFFPNLVSASRPAVLLSLGEKKYTKLYTWCLECTNARHFFTPRYLHTLFIQLIKCERNEVMSECKIWKNGILIVHSNGTRSIIEVTDQTTRVSLAIQCVEGYELQLVKQRSQLVTLIKSLVLKTCPNVEVKEFLLLSQSNYPPEKTAEILMAKVACSVIESAAYVSYKDRYGMTISDDNDALEHVLVTDLLFFDPFHIIKDEILRNVFAHHLSDNIVPLATVTRIHSAAETCRELQERFEDEAGQCRRDMTYSQLYRELIKYSIFTDGKLYVSNSTF